MPSNEIRAELLRVGIPPAQLGGVMQAVELGIESRAREHAAQLVLNIYLRIDRDSIEGRAFARVFGFDFGRSGEEAAKAFGMSKQYLHRRQREIAARLGDLVPRKTWVRAPENTGPSTE